MDGSAHVPKWLSQTAFTWLVCSPLTLSRSLSLSGHQGLEAKRLEHRWRLTRGHHRRPTPDQSPNACIFFKWEDEYEKYLIESGFLEEDTEVPTISVDDNLHLCENVVELKGTVQHLQKSMAEIQSCMNQMKAGICTLKHHTGSNMSYGTVVVLVAMVVVVGVVLCVALVKLG